MAAILAAGAAVAGVVGDTHDACDGSNSVSFETKNGTVHVPRSATQTFDLPSATREINWYCAGSRERSANDKPFNRVQITRADNGAIHWVFIMSAVQNEPVRVGDTKDGCDGKQPVTFRGSGGAVSVAAGAMRMVDLPELTRQIFWKCGKSSERSANPNEFNRVQIERAGNGAIQWIFYRTMSVTGPDIGNFHHNVRGDIFLAAHVGNTNVPLPPLASGILKQTLDKAWDSQRSTLAQKVKDAIPADATAGLPGKLQINSIDLSTSSKGELRVAQTSSDITLKYVVHENQIHAKLIITDPAPDPGFVATFDIAVVLILPRSQALASLQVNRAGAFIEHVEISGSNFAGDVAIGAFKSKVRAAETDINTQSADLTGDVNGLLKTASAEAAKKVPLPAAFVNVDSDAVGDVRVCAAQVAGSACVFPGTSGALPSPKVVGTSTDQCGENKIWLWDSERGRFISATKGQSGLVVQVDDKRFEWFCGDDSQPDPSANHDEWASGPTGTYAVRVSRDPSNRQINWQFLSWHP